MILSGCVVNIKIKNTEKLIIIFADGLIQSAISQAIIKFILAWVFISASLSYAEMKPLEDEELSNISGQAFVSINEDIIGNREYLRVDLGMEINTQLNIDEFKVGEYHRWENGEPCPECDGTELGLEQQPADIWIKNLSLGSIAEFSGIQMDGKYYEQGEIIPFSLLDPYLEIVKENDELVGFRAGVHKARGTFGGEILSMTGNVPITIKDTASALMDAPNRPWWIALAGAILGGTPVESEAALVSAPTGINGDIDYSTGGQPNAVRATHIGLPDNADFSIGPIPFIGNINFNTTDCNLFGIPTCFPLTQFESLNVGEKQDDGTFEPTGGWFLSMQNKPVDWVDPVNQNIIRAPTGAFFSVPVGGVELNLNQAFEGVPRERVEYINRGNNLF